jgi:cysteinyl-tRNA synthetase
MSMKYLGETFDIHCGGIDHVPVHHTNEIAQSECATHHVFVRYWMHGEFLLMNKEKISKSKGGYINTVEALINAGYDPLAYRYFCLQTHYRSELNFSVEALEAATAGLRRVYALRPDDDPLKSDADYAAARARVLAALNDDLAAPQAVGLLNSYRSYRLWTEFDAVLGLDIARRAAIKEASLPDEVQQLVDARNQARKAKQWAQSDALRDQLIALGYEVGDGPQGTTVKAKTL